MRIVMVINKSLPPGLAANTAAVLGISLGKELPEIIGDDIEDASGYIHKGITGKVIPVLAADDNTLKKLAFSGRSDEALKIIGFSKIAQSIHNYDEYTNLLEKTGIDSIEYSGICLYGSNKKIERLTASLALLK